MKEQQKKFITLFAWCVVVLFVVRCLISLKSIISGVSLYDMYGYASEAIGVAVILAATYEKILWRINPLEKTPKLARHYSGTLKSNYDNIERTGTLIVKQTLLSVHVKLVTDESKSKSLSASIDEILGEAQLTYCYLNTPKSEFRNRSEIHYGTAILTITEEKLEGQYYTDRKTVGDMYFVANK